LNSCIVSMNWFVYILRCDDGSLYAGITTDVNRREYEHNNSPKGAKYTRARRPVKVVYYKSFKTRSEAATREASIKKLSTKEKQKLTKQKH